MRIAAMDVFAKVKYQVASAMDIEAEPPPPPPAPASQSIWDDLSDDFTLSKQQRLAGFVLSAAMGAVCLLIAVWFVPIIVLVPAKFAFFFTFGNIFCVCSTGFLVGPLRQLKAMVQRDRILSSALYFGSMVATLLSALWLRSMILVLVFTCLQVGALVWYCLSYIPFAQHVLKHAFRFLQSSS
eukprot:RCo044973